MNRALVYLWFTLLKRKTIQICQSLWRPATLVGFAAVASFVGFLFYHNDHVIFTHLVQRRSVIGLMLVMLGGSLFKGFLQRGLTFEPPDIEFLFTGPFGQKEIIFYRLWPNYLFAIVEAIVFCGLFWRHLAHPFLTTLCFIFFQVACFHLRMAASIFAGRLSERVHYRVRWMMLGVYFVITVVYFRTEWDLRIIPSIAMSSWFPIFFYPAGTLSSVGTETPIHLWALDLIKPHFFSVPNNLWQPIFYTGAFATGALLSLWMLLRLKENFFETSLATTIRLTERRLRIQQGRRAVISEQTQAQSLPLPKLAMFRGVGAILWKNIVIARRSKRELVLAFAFTLVYTGFLAALLWLAHSTGVTLGPDGPRIGDAIIGLLFFLGFLLQRTFPFDFRADGHHLLNFRTLPVSAFTLALAEIAVPTICCLAFQAMGMVALMIFTEVSWFMMLFQLLAFPAVALALNSVWNLHYLISASKSAGGKAQPTSAVGMLLVVALSFLVFFPAGWTGLQIGNHVDGKSADWRKPGHTHRGPDVLTTSQVFSLPLSFAQL